MKGRFDALLARYGQPAALTDRQSGTTVEVRAFVQPVLKRQEDVPAAVTALGAVSEERWLYLGGADTPVHPGDRVACGHLRLTVQEARCVFWKDQVAYRWAMLRPEREAAV